MRRLKGFFALISLALWLFQGCSTKPLISRSTPYLVSIKTPQMAFSDTGFLNEAPGYKQLNIISMGHSVLNLEIHDRICLDGTCLDKLAFNTHFFGQEHYANLLRDIIEQRPLYEGKAMVVSNQGFHQEIDLPEAHIVYRVEGMSVWFKETHQGVMIRLRPL